MQKGVFTGEMLESVLGELVNLDGHTSQTMNFDC